MTSFPAMLPKVLFEAPTVSRPLPSRWSYALPSPGQRVVRDTISGSRYQWLVESLAASEWERVDRLARLVVKASGEVLQLCVRSA